MKRVITGIDGSEPSLTALAWSIDVAERTGAELTAARVFEPDQAELPSDRYEEMKTEQRQELIEYCDTVPGATSIEMRHAILDGDSPPDVLLDAAADPDVDLLVVGGRGSGGFPNLHLGSVAHHLAHNTDVPLAIVPDNAPGRLGRVVVGVDGSEESRHAAAVGAALAGPSGASVTAVYAHEPFFEWVPYSDDESWYSQAESQIRDWVQVLEKAGVNLDVKVDRDINPVAAIERTLDEHPASVAVVGKRGVGGFPELRVGRTPLQLVHHTGHPVVVVPAEAGDDTTT